MTTHAIASTGADAAAGAAVERHHAQLAGALALQVEAVRAASLEGDIDASRAIADQLVAWCESELIPHAAAEETTLYAAARARPEGRLLVDAMLAEHRVITGLVREIASATTRFAAAQAARALAVVVDSHLEKENTLVLPLLVSAPDVSVADLLGGLHELIGTSGQAPTAATTPSAVACGCTEADAARYPELDARAIPHAIRHATVFGALDSVRPGSGMVLVAPHDPKPLLAQLERRSPGAFHVDYLQRGPTDWRLTFLRQPA